MVRGLLRPHPNWAPCPGPVVTVVMDGIGIGRRDRGDAVWLATTPSLDRLELGSWVPLVAHGTAVGLPSDQDMGNSEVGHNILGAGRTFDQGARLVEEALSTGRLFGTETWNWVVGSAATSEQTVHLVGLLSDGKVHSHQDHLHALLRELRRVGARRVCVHILLDGRDVAATSALEYVEALEAVLAELGRDGADFLIASGGGRISLGDQGGL